MISEKLTTGYDTTHPRFGIYAHQYLSFVLLLHVCIQCFDAVSWRQEAHPACKKTEWWGAGVVICLESGADLHTA